MKGLGRLALPNLQGLTTTTSAAAEPCLAETSLLRSIALSPPMSPWQMWHLSIAALTAR